MVDSKRHSIFTAAGRRRLIRRTPWKSACAALLLIFAPIAPGVRAADSQLQGSEAPDFVLRTLAHRNLRLSEYRGQVVLLNFWASWCGACRQAMPVFNQMYDKYQRAGLVMLSIDLDDELRRAESMSHSLKIRFPVLFDERKEVARLYRVQNMPLTVLIDREGTVRFVYEGYNAGDEAKFVAPLRELLNE